MGAAIEESARILDRQRILQGGELDEGLVDHVLRAPRTCPNVRMM